MKLYKLSGVIGVLAFMSLFSACEDTTTTIGSSIASGEVQIYVDSLYYNLKANPIRIENFDSKSGNLMIGSIRSDEYGSLDCSFVTRLMCAGNLEVPDSLFSPSRVDSCKLIMGAARKGITGDSLAPQALAVYKLTKQLPSDINNSFNPDGYYNPQETFGKKSYTVSGIAGTDSAFYNNQYVEITVDLPKEFGEEVFMKYKNEPELFQWPSTMAKDFLPGLYVKPTFGNGCVANINNVYVGIYYHSLQDKTNIVDGDTIKTQTHVTHLAVPFTVSPEVLSSNNISYSPSDNIIEWNATKYRDEGVVITTPGGYIADFEFPVQSLIDIYYEKNNHLSTVNDLLLYIPAEVFDEESGMSVASNMLLIKSSEYEEFFNENKVPDNKSSFTGVYDSVNKRYIFTSLRNYFLDILKKSNIEPEDLQFTLVPVDIVTETVSGYYQEGATYVTKCTPYTAKPTMTLLKTNEAMVTFSFSTQIID